ncbi:MAG: hypothetical protein JWN02_333 [Acidobacteria bacterium]|nr:hypothetical protein [Acidobacteriota bacterium]
MAEQLDAVRAQLARQVVHWVTAAARLDPDDLASAESWSRLERYLGISIRKHLEGVIARLCAEADILTVTLRTADSAASLGELQQRLVAFRRKFMRAETTLDFYADAISTRTGPHMAGLLRACDILAHRSMSLLLDQLGHTSPVVLTYVDKGLGASILKAGLRLWDGGAENPAAAIKIVRHNLLRPTALIHEAGHQAAHVTDWNRELAETLGRGLGDGPDGVAGAWAGWASEIAADAFAFVHTGYASVAALHDVLAGEQSFVFQHVPLDPHPVCYLRVLLGVESCRYFYGPGPWDALALAWIARYPLEGVSPGTRRLVEQSTPLLSRIVRLTLDTPQRAFRGRPLRALIQPERVSPGELQAMEARLGPSLYTSMHWVWEECLRLLALTGWQVAARPATAGEALKSQEAAMLRLGGSLQAA